MITLEQIRTCVQEEVYGELAEWGTSAKIVWTKTDKVDTFSESLRIFMNKLCDPLIEVICKRIEEEYNLDNQKDKCV